MNITLYELLILMGVPAIVVSVVNAFARFVINKHKDKKEDDKDKWDEHEAIRKGLQALLRDRLQQGCRFYMERGYCTFEEKATYEAMYNCYHQELRLPNGVMEECHKAVMELPIRKGE